MSLSCGSLTPFPVAVLSWGVPPTVFNLYLIMLFQQLLAFSFLCHHIWRMGVFRKMSHSGSATEGMTPHSELVLPGFFSFDMTY